MGSMSSKVQGHLAKPDEGFGGLLNPIRTTANIGIARKDPEILVCAFLPLLLCNNLHAGLLAVWRITNGEIECMIRLSGNDILALPGLPSELLRTSLFSRD